MRKEEKTTSYEQILRAFESFEKPQRQICISLCGSRANKFRKGNGNPWHSFGFLGNQFCRCSTCYIEWAQISNLEVPNPDILWQNIDVCSKHMLHRFAQTTSTNGIMITDVHGQKNNKANKLIYIVSKITDISTFTNTSYYHPRKSLQFHFRPLIIFWDNPTYKAHLVQVAGACNSLTYCKCPSIEGNKIPWDKSCNQ